MIIDKMMKRSILRLYSTGSGGPGSPLYPKSKIPVPPHFDPIKYRQWIRLNPNSIPEEKKVSIMSYNLLSQHYLWRLVFGYLKQDYLDWSNYRFPLINKTIEYFQSDIICFQELECSIYEKQWKNGFPLSHYKSIYIKKLNPLYWGNKPSSQMDGVAIFVNSDKFDIIDYQTVNFSEYIQTHRDKFSLTNDLLKRVVPRNTVAIIVQLYDKVNDKNIFVTNTHLYWSPKFNDVKLFQSKLLINLLKEFITNTTKESNPHIIMCGDFNSIPESMVFRFLNNEVISLSKYKDFEKFNYGHKLNNEIIINDEIKNPFDLSSAYDILLSNHNYSKHKLNFTSYTRNLTAVLDHIWYSSQTFNVVKILSEVDENYTWNFQVKGFPNEQFPSDHIPLIAEVAYNS